MKRIRKMVVGILIVFGGLLVPIASASLADCPPSCSDPRYDSNKPHVSITSTQDGYYIHIAAGQSVPGNPGSPPSPAGAAGTTNPSVPGNTTAGSQQTSTGSSQAAQNRSWSDANGYHEETPDGHILTVAATHGDISGSLPHYNWVEMQQQHPNATPYAVSVDGKFTQVIWIPNGQHVQAGAPPANGVDPGAPPASTGSAVDPYQVALDVYAHVPLPGIQIRVNPELGLVAHPSNFWLAGYDGRPFGASRSISIPPAVGDDVPFDVVPRTDPRRQAIAFTVEVQVRAAQYRWDFGDGTSLSTTSLGQAYPATSEIQHRYETSSFYQPDGFAVQLTTRYEALWRVNDGGWQPLPAIQKTTLYGYPVQEIQTILTSP